MDCRIEPPYAVVTAKAAVGSLWEDTYGRGEFVTEVCVDSSGNVEKRQIPARKLLEWAKDGKL
jgi:hypothetical protein